MGNPIPYFPVSTTDNNGAVLKVRTKETINGTWVEGRNPVPNSRLEVLRRRHVRGARRR